VYTARISISGHLIDSGLLSRLLDAVSDLGGKFEIVETQFGRMKEEESCATIEVGADTCEELDKILDKAKELGATVFDGEPVQLAVVEQDGVCPDEFYTSTNIETYVNIDGHWVPVDDIEMDCAIVVDAQKPAARCCPLAAVSRGEYVVVGSSGI